MHVRKTAATESFPMKLRLPYLTPLFFCTLLCGATFAEAVKDREAAVRNDRAAMEKNGRWIYNDYQRGFAEAKRTGKPLLVVLRCVPCLACAGIDAQVLEEADLAPLLDQFVCVRVINANALDLKLFQFDYDLSFATMFFNGDGTVYGRFGSWTHQKNEHDKDTSAYKSALRRVLAVHRDYPGNKTSLAGKQGGAVPFDDPLKIPGLAGKYERDLDWKGKVVQSCVHCHQISDAFRESYRAENRPIPTEWIYPWPAPETIGLTLTTSEAATRVEAVDENSIAVKSGFRAGDELISLEQQPLVSIADVSWVLNRAPVSGATLEARVKRGSAEISLPIVLSNQWRTQTDISRRVGTWGMRGMATGGLVLEDVDDTERAARKIPADQMALLVKHVGQYNKHAAAKRAGFQQNDIIVEMDGLKSRMSESALIGRLLQTRTVGERVKAEVLRGTERVALEMPMQ
jgi:hypothetical protein